VARWNVFENRNGTVSVVYRDRLTGYVHACGELRRDTPRGMIVDWVVKIGESNPGDIIHFDDGTVFFHQPPTSA